MNSIVADVKAAPKALQEKVTKAGEAAIGEVRRRQECACLRFEKIFLGGASKEWDGNALDVGDVDSECWRAGPTLARHDYRKRAWKGSGVRQPRRLLP